jgi:uracil-DNA glycosylase
MSTVPVDVKIEASWKAALADEFAKPYFGQLTEFMRGEYARRMVYPHPKNIFRAFDLCPFGRVKVVILGQDPYHGPGQAHGLSFSVQHGIQNPPSLQNIYKEICADLGVAAKADGDLTTWAEQGVLLLNATLTVVAGQAGSHQRQGWEEFTDAVIRRLSDGREHLVFLLWGAYAQGKAPLIDSSKHCVLKAPHPSPLSAHRGFLGCKHFSQANAYLEAHGQTPINWVK